MAEPANDPLTVVISSTAYDLEQHREHVQDACARLGHRHEMMEHLTAASASAVDVSLALVDRADVYVGILAFRYGFVPPESKISITEMEYRRAKERGIPCLMFFMGDKHPITRGDFDTGESAERLERLKEEISKQLVVGYFDSPDELETKVLQALFELRRPTSSEPERSPQPQARLRGWPELKLPEQPYPLLLPYTHPALFAGRERELAELRKLLAEQVPIVLLHAPSGAGKSSLLRAGLAPALDAEGIPVALDDRPADAGLGPRLITGLLASGEGSGVDEPALDKSDAGAFVAYLRHARRLAGQPPVLIVDQFEELFTHPERRGVAGLLLAASLEHQPSVGPPPVRWVLAYRQEFHGEVRSWLGAVLEDAKRARLPALDGLPRDLSGIRHSRDWALRLFATPRSDEAADAEGAFLAAIEAPLAARGAGGRRRYALRFAGDGARRLAAAFADSRHRQPEAPLVPELQVVLAKLLDDAIDGEVGVGEDPRQLIDEALEKHLRAALDLVFPRTRDGSHRAARSRALLALRRLADAEGRRGASLPAAPLARAFAPEGEPTPEELAAGSAMLERLAAKTRLLIGRLEDDGTWYALSHDRMAEVVVRTVEEEGRRGKLEVDPELLGLRRYVEIMTRLFRAGESRQATGLPRERFEAVRGNAEALLWDDDHRRWWRACQERQVEDRSVLIEQLSSPSASKVLEALAVLPVSGAEGEVVRQQVRRREDWHEIFGDGPGGVAEREREDVVLAAVSNAAVCWVGDTEIRALGAAAWAIDRFPGRSESPAVRERASAAREALLEPLRRRRPPPEAQELSWATIPGGSFAMGREGEDPGREVTVSPQRMLAHPLTNALYRRLVEEHEGGDDLPLVKVDWFTAYAYAAWLGGRLPTEAEWEYAARGGSLYAYADRHGKETTLDKVGWYNENSRRELHPVMQLEPNPWGLYDMYGNVWEWVGDRYAEYSEEAQVDPWGPPSGQDRVLRGGGCLFSAGYARAAFRDWVDPEDGDVYIGFRVVLPGPRSRSSGDLGS